MQQEDPMKQQQMNVYARFIVDEPRTETEPAPAKKGRGANRVATTARSPKGALKKRAALPK